MSPKNGRDYFVYFMEAVGLDCIKIGETAPIYANDDDTRAAKRRLSIIQSTCPVEIKLLGTTRRFNEKMIHSAFASLKVRGEWYKATPELRAFIENVGP